MVFERKELCHRTGVMGMKNKWTCCLGLAALAALAGCSIGPTEMKSDRARYNMAVQRSANEQILLNLVRLKYREPTLFLEIGSISANFNYSLGADVGGIFPKSGENVGTVSGAGRYAENPTITYSPLQGEQFAKRLMAELDMKTFILLERAGWNIGRLMRLTVEQFGDLRNDPTLPPAPGETESGYSRFLKLTELLVRLKKDGILRFGLEPSKGVRVAESLAAEGMKPNDLISAHKEGYEIVQREDKKVDILKSGPPSLIIEGELSSKDREELFKCLGYKRKSLRWDAAGTGSVVFCLRDGKTEERIEVPLRLRSFLDILFYLGQGTDVPASHAKKGYVKARWHEAKESRSVDWTVWRNSTMDLLDVRCSLLPPSEAFVSIPYRRHWFYIDDGDSRSKDTFALLSIIFSLQAGEVPAMLPVLTIPVSGR
jgi:hypothetical protein